MTVAFQTPAHRIQPVSAAPKPPARPLRVGVLTPHNPYDKRTFSGTVFHAVRALSRREDIALSVLGPHRRATGIDRLLRRAPQRFDPPALLSGGDVFAGLDVVLGLVATPLLDAAAAMTDLPFIHVTDATPGFLREVYGRDVPRTADAREARVLERATAIYSSRFMAEQAVAEFGACAHRARGLPFGANFTTLPSNLPQKAPLNRLELLFVGADWTRKGGATALGAFDALRAGGREAHLTIVGHVPQEVRAGLRGRSDVTLAGFLDKNISRDMARLATLYTKAHLMLLPSRADCTPMVVAEALAHGTPVLASDVGGIGEMVGQGAGRILPLEAGAADWAEAITELSTDTIAYAFRSDAAAERTQTRLNWSSWADGIAATAAELALPGLSQAA